MSLLDLSLPHVDAAMFDKPTGARLSGANASSHAPRFLLLYGSLRERSYSKLLTLEAARLLIAMGGEVRVFDPAGLPLPDDAPETHSKVQELRESAAWAEGITSCPTSMHNAECAREVLGLPEGHSVSIVLALGYPDESKPLGHGRVRLSLEELVHRERW